MIELAKITNDAGIMERFQKITRDFAETYLQIGRDYAEVGCYQEAVDAIALCTQEKPMIFYYTGYCLKACGKTQEGIKAYQKADSCSPLYCFPNKSEDIAVLQDAIETYPGGGAKASYYLGNLYYDKLQYELAVKLWEDSVALDDTYPTVLRNLALAYYNKQGKKEEAKEKLERAFALDETDARVFLELDQLYKKSNYKVEDRLDNFEKHKELTKERGDVLMEYITLHNLLGRHEEAYEIFRSNRFRPWEGAEGKITTQYKTVLCEMAKDKLKVQAYKQARQLLEEALVYPRNLGEGRMEDTRDNHLYYYLGCALEKEGYAKRAEECFLLAAAGKEEPAGMMYYNDQPADMILYQGLAQKKLENIGEANSKFYKLMDYGEKHMRDNMRIDYFAVSLPDFLIFDEDLNRRNRAHCHYLIGLSKLGLGKREEAKAEFEQALEWDRNHQNALLYKKMTCDDIQIQNQCSTCFFSSYGI